MENLPKNWVNVPFTEVLGINGGTQPPKSQFISEPKKGYIRLLQIRDFGKKPVPTYIPDTGKLRTCTKDDILIARYGASIGRIVTGQEGSYNVALAKVSIPEKINKDLIKWLLKSHIFQNVITSFQRTAQSGFNKDDLSSINIPLPPIAEQQRIVVKLDDLFGHLEQVKTRLEKIPDLLKNFRQAILTQAVTGKLTEEWREGKELEEPNLNVALGDFLVEIKYGTSKKSDYGIDGMPILRIPNIKKREVDLTDLKFSDLDKKEYEKVLLKKGDILIIRSNGSISIVGKTAIVRDQKNLGYAGYLVRLRSGDKLNPEFLNYSLASPLLRRQIEEKARSTSGVNNINTTEIKELIVNVFDLKEQTEIVSRVESLFAKSDAIEAKYNTLKAQIDSLPQAILAKAFKGELVEQLPTDGNAAALLEEIQKMKAELAPKKKKMKKQIKLTKG